MSIINELVKHLRNIYQYGTTYEETKKAIEQAADTIEALSAKLTVMEHGEWISHKNKPQRKSDESSRPVLVKYKDKTAHPEVCSYNFLTGKFMFIEKDVTKFVKEWREIPE